MYQGKFISKDKQVLLINTRANDIFEAERKILDKFDTMVDYHSFDYNLVEVNSK